MKLNSYFLGIITAATTAFSIVYVAEPGGGTIYIESGPIEEREIMWTGPGWYYGIWFGDEYEYRQYYRHRHHRNHYDRHRDGRRDGGHRRDHRDDRRR